MRYLICSTLVSCACLMANPGDGGAQITVELGPRVGYYRPTGDFNGGIVTSGGLPHNPHDLAGIAWGAAARVWLGRRVGFDAQAAMVRSEISAVNTPAGWISPATRAVVVPMSFHANFAFLDHPFFRSWLGVGLSVVRHGGDAYSSVGPLTKAAPSATFGTSVRILNGLRAAAGVSGMRYMYNVPRPSSWSASGETSLQRGWCTPLMVMVGLDWRVR